MSGTASMRSSSVGSGVWRSKAVTAYLASLDLAAPIELAKLTAR